MWRFTCVPRNVYDFLYPYQAPFSLCASPAGIAKHVTCHTFRNV